MDGHTRCERCNHWILDEKMDWHMRIGHSPGVESFLATSAAALKGEHEGAFIDLWAIQCTTGCSCCAYENFDKGFYRSEEEANKQKAEWLKGNGNPLSSQYARYGRYMVYRVRAEVISKQRMIIGGMIHPLNFFGEFGSTY